MNHAEFLSALDYRKRLEKTLMAASQTMSEQGFRAFSEGVNHELTRLDKAISGYVTSPEGKFASWMGLKTRSFSVSALQEPRPEPKVFIACNREDYSIKEAVSDATFASLQTC